MRQNVGSDKLIEEQHRCFGLGGYFMAAVLAASSYSRGGFSPRLAVSVGVLGFQVEVRSTWNLEQYTLAVTLLVPDVFDAEWISHKLHSFLFVIEGGVIFSSIIPPV